MRLTALVERRGRAMGSFKRTLLEVVALGVLGVVLGAGANAVRGSDGVSWFRDYFKVRPKIDEPRDSGKATVADAVQEQGGASGESNAGRFGAHFASQYQRMQR